MIMNNYDELEKQIGYIFKDESHLDIAFTHKSYANELMIKGRESYERYEFLGDAILEYLVSRYLFNEYKDKAEGELTKLRASLVCEFTLSKISRELSLGKYGFFSKGERQSGGSNRDSILCDMFESLLGAIYLDGGLDEADKFVKAFLLTDIEHKKLFYDSKTRLQEYAQKNSISITYHPLREEGPEHDKLFVMEARLNGVTIGYGEGKSKKTAQQHAAYDALLKQHIK